jgi:hypothetical protein
VELDVTEAGVEEAGEGLRAPPADLGIGAEGKPPLGHATEAAERPVGHPGQDLDQGVLRQARRGLLLLLVLMFLQMGEMVQFRFVLIHTVITRSKIGKQEQWREPRTTMARWRGTAATNGMEMERPCRGLGGRSPAGCPDPCRLLPLLLVASPTPWIADPCNEALAVAVAGWWRRSPNTGARQERLSVSSSVRKRVTFQ